MSAWKDFLKNDVFDPTGKPGKVMICFLNRFLEGLDGIKYKLVVDGKPGPSGTTTEENFCIELAPTTFTSIETYVWSRMRNGYKKLDDVVPRRGRKLLVYKRLNTFKVKGTTQEHPKNPKEAPQPMKPAPAPPPGPSPTSNQGTQPAPTRQDQTGAPLDDNQRPVPGQITAEQLQKIFPAAPLNYLQEIADECNKDLAKYKLDTFYRRAHFFAQIRGETGPAMTPRNESWCYSPATLRGFSHYYRTHHQESEEDGYLK